MALTEIPIELSSTPGIVDNSNATAITIDASENVGIGTSSPAAKLDLGTSTGQKLLMYANSNIKYGMSIETSNYRIFAEDQASLTFGHMARTDGTTYTERLRIDSSGRVGIGMTANSGCLLNVNDHIRAENSAFLAGRETAALPAFAFHDDTDTGMFNVASNILAFSTAGSERMRIDSSGNLLVGKTSTGDYVTGIEMQPAGAILSYRTGGVASIFGRTDTGEITRFTQNSSIIGRIGTTASAGGTRFAIGAVGDPGIIFAGTGVFPATEITASDNVSDLGSASYRWKDLYLSGGVVFGTTGGSVSSKTLEDYEEGTWTGTATAGAATSISVADEKYTKIGNQVTIQCTINFSGASGALNIAGLPFATSPACAGIGREDATSGYAIYGRSQSGSATFDLFYAGAVSNATPFQVAAGNMRYSMTYLT